MPRPSFVHEVPSNGEISTRSIDAALQQLRADNPQAAAAKQALQNLLAELDRPSDGAAGKAQTTASAKLSIKDVITALEKLRAGESVLDVSFEPKDGQPAYAVRTYAKGKVWDGLIDGVTGAAIDNGTVTDESALDDEDKAELAASKHAENHAARGRRHRPRKPTTAARSTPDWNRCAGASYGKFCFKMPEHQTDPHRPDDRQDYVRGAERGVAERDKLAPAGQLDWIEKRLIPRHKLNPQHADRSIPSC